ncbi:hypothetical protein B566_EDAN009134 [Ephemera danica]|nr:hypothetical protein B566_EDAN009134 [Ephemera danica]
MYVDYGNESWVDMKNVRCIDSEFLHLPFMAVEITTEDMVANKGCDKEAVQELSTLTENTELSATCVGGNVKVFEPK